MPDFRVLSVFAVAAATAVASAAPPDPRPTAGHPVADLNFAYGNPDDPVVVGDWNGDGKDTPGVIRFP